MVVEAAPSASLIITKPEFLFQLLIIALDPPSQLCPDRPDDRRRYLRAKWQTNTWSARFRLPATRSGATLQRATRSASCRDAPAALSAGQSARRADPRFPRAKRSFATPLAAGRGRVS